MSSIDISQLHVPDAIIACQLDGEGGMLPITSAGEVGPTKPCWVHLDYSSTVSRDWLQSTPLIPDTVRDALAGDSLRPRISRLADGFMLVLRSINHNDNARPDQLVAVRVFINGDLIITTRKRKARAIDTVWEDLQNGNGAENAGNWIVEFCDALTEQSGEFIEQLYDRIIALEDALLDGKVPARGEMALLRKQLIVMRRYMAPQRDVFARIANEKFTWMADEDRRLMQDTADRLGRGLEDLDAGIARTAVISDEIDALIAESMNRRTYIMSLMAMVFLPATFLTGLFGVNLGGIPGGNWHYGFAVFCIILAAIAIAVTLWLKSRKWL
ncbi:zinc transporter ZntB [Rosenbergiella nectarea]|uniref:zinc transporter ZntB n=1 Tax=Rosenbergiella nectarea TaxID=988801 RepID=UPI001BDA14B3|nr:zinc transporter ZntB [Rosenbergiella nectarea]MBT0729271.1 zinc transporter ZntB [Rosenbergiella nectarea subsp. apis]